MGGPGSGPRKGSGVLKKYPSNGIPKAPAGVRKITRGVIKESKLPKGIIKEKTTKNKMWTAIVTKERGGFYTKTILHPNGRGSGTTKMDHFKFHKTRADALKEYKKQSSGIGK